MSIFSPIRLLVRKASPIPGLVGLRLALEQEVAARFDAHSGFNGWRMAEYLKDQGEMKNGSLLLGGFLSSIWDYWRHSNDDGTQPVIIDIDEKKNR